ncbi:unnamed protein product [Phytomonas sp. EM1]|nr:unnamed protein product [Phytomonas sp. EM1]|eukprot:CCW60725.1 unnamed protein product [Phytomonas sp. isolate EM1]
MLNLLVGRYQRIGEIGRGGFGMVEEFLDLVTGNTVAIKTIPPYFVQHESKRMIREVDIMRFLHNAHPHVIDFIAMFVTRCRGGVTSQVSNPEPYAPSLDVTGPLYEGLSENEKAIMHHDYLAKEISTIRKDEGFSLHIVLPLMKGDLFYFINLLSSGSGQRQHRLSEGFLKQVAAVFAFQLVFGLDWVHKCGIVHRDLKPDNVLVRLNTENAFYSSLCIADFGLARNMQSSDTFYVCTRNYRPPEIITCAILSQPSMDIWSLGCILYEMCTGETLFKMPTALDSQGVWNGVMASSQLEIILSIVGTPSEEDIRQHMPEGNAKTYLLRSMSRPSQLEKLMEQRWTLPTLPEETLLWRSLIKSCLAFFPQQRPTAEELSRHALFIRYQMIVGRNIHQLETQLYKPSIAESELKSKTIQISSLLRIIQDTMVETRPTFEEEEESEEESFLEEEEVVNRNNLDGVRHCTSSTPIQAPRLGNCEGDKETEADDEASSGAVYFGKTWGSNQSVGRISCATEEEANSQSREVMQPLELPDIASRVNPPQAIDPKPPKLTTPLDPDLQWYVVPQEEEEIPWQGWHANSFLEVSQPPEHGSLTRKEDTLPGHSEETRSTSFSTSAYQQQRNGIAPFYHDPEPHDGPSWSPYLHEQPYQNNTHVYNVTKPYSNSRENSFIGLKLHVGEKRGSEAPQAGPSWRGFKDGFAVAEEEGAPPSTKPNRGGRSQYTLLTTSCHNASDASSSVVPPSLNVVRSSMAISFPDIHDPALRARYGNLDHTDDTLQVAIESILGELNQNRRDMAISLELRALLSYFCALRGSR